MRTRMFMFGVCALLAATSAYAHGPQIQITVDNNQIVTRQLLKNEPYSSAVGLTAPISVYAIPVLPVSYLGQPVSRVKPTDTQTFGPGFMYGYDQVDGGDRDFTAPLNLNVAGLQIWDGGSFVPTGLEQLGLLQSSSNVNPDSAITTAGGGNLAIAISATYTADSHSSARYTLLGDGVDPYASSRDGVYLATLQLSGTQIPSLTPSDTFYFVLNKNASADDVAAAVDSLGISAGRVQFVPEPCGALLAVLGLIGVIGATGSARLRPRR